MTASAPHLRLKACRSCGGGPFHVLHDFGVAPIADRLVDPKNPSDDLHAPLTFVLCPDCGLAQIQETVAPRFLFSAEYPYFSSVSKGLLAHFHQSADALIRQLGLSGDSLVVEAASNDGYMLRRFQEAGIGVLGIDPSDGPVAVARAHGVETIHGFFGAVCAQGIAEGGRRADLFLANNVLAHVADTDDFVAGITTVLSETGTAVLEFPYLVDLVDHCAFDTIYHQHLLYLTLNSVRPIFERHGLYLNDVERTGVHGGSLRITVTRTLSTTQRLRDLIAQEDARGVGTPAFFAPMLDRMQTLRIAFRAMLDEYKTKGVTLAGYGAAAKATTLLHHCGVGQSDLVFIADKNTWKHGLEMPGSRIPIVPPDTIDAVDVQAVVVLAWNFANEIMRENAEYAANGGNFIVPIPQLIITNGTQTEASL